MEHSLGPTYGTHYLRYLFASAVSLSADLLVFISAIHFGIAAVPSAVAGYTSGLAIHWLLSSRFVFSDSTRTKGAERVRQKCLFLASALAGLCITTIIVGSGQRWGVDPRIAKLVALCISFQATYLLRSKVVFS